MADRAAFSNIFTRRIAQLSVLGVFFITAQGYFSTMADAADTPSKTERIISLSATGTVTARPDRASISTGVSSEADTARMALNENTAAMSKIIAALKTQGLSPKHIQTTDFSVHPRYRHYKDGRPAEVTGYKVTNSVRIQVIDLEKLGAILDQVVTLGGNEIGGISFELSNLEEMKNKAREAAMAKAIEKAKLYAKAAGVKLGKVISIQEHSFSPGPRPMMRTAMAAEAASVPIEAGENSVSINLNVSWALED